MKLTPKCGIILQQKLRNRATSRTGYVDNNLRLLKRTTKKKIDPRWNEIHRRHPPRYSIARQFHMFSPLASEMPPKIRNRLNQSYRGLRVHKPKEVQNSEKKPASSWACRSLISGKTPRCGMRDVANYWILTWYGQQSTCESISSRIHKPASAVTTDTPGTQLSQASTPDMDRVCQNKLDLIDR